MQQTKIKGIFIDPNQKPTIEEISSCISKMIEDRKTGKTPTLSEFPESGRKKETVSECLKNKGII